MSYCNEDRLEFGLRLEETVAMVVGVDVKVVDIMAVMVADVVVIVLDGAKVFG